MDIRYKSYKVTDDIFNYVEIVNGFEVTNQIPLYIGTTINPLALTVVTEIKRVKKLLKDRKINDITPHMDFYKSLVNPLDSIETMAILVNSYADDGGYGGVYYAITHAFTGRKKFKAKINTADRDYFYAKVFNRWKKNIIKLGEDNKLENAPKLKVLAKKLEEINDIKTYNEYLRCLTDDLIAENCFSAYGIFSGWEHFSSKYIDVGSHKELKSLDHRLYINIEGFALYAFLNEFLKKCYERKLPYYFKFVEACTRDDSVVVYSDTNHFLKFLEILKEIGREHPEIIEYTDRPPLLTGVVNDYIGYGSEPHVEGKHISFNEIREKVITNAFDITVDEWLKSKISSGIMVNNRQMSVVSLLAEVGSTQIYNYYKELYDKYLLSGNLKYFYDYYGLTEADFANHSFRLLLFDKLKLHIGKIISDPNYLLFFSNDACVKTRNGKKIEFDLRTVYKIKKGVVKYIFTYDNELINTLKRNINMLAKVEGIDTLKFCFDERLIDKFITQDKYLKRRTEIEQNLNI